MYSWIVCVSSWSILTLTPIPSISRSHDIPDRHDCPELQMQHWIIQMPRLLDAYLDYCAWDSGDGIPVIEPQDETSGSIEDIKLIDLFSKSYLHKVEDLLTGSIPRLSAYNYVYPNETLMYHGYIGCPPICPTIALSLWTLSAFRQMMHRTCLCF